MSKHNFCTEELYEQFDIALSKGKKLLQGEMRSAEPYLIVYLIDKINELEVRLKEVEEQL